MAEVLNPFGPSSTLLVSHLRYLLCPAQRNNLPLSWIIPFGEWRALSLHIYVDMDVHGLFLSDMPLLWSDTFRNEAHFNYLINTKFSCTQFPHAWKLAWAGIFLGTLIVNILDLVNNFIDPLHHSANPVLHVDLHIPWYTLSQLPGFGTTRHVLSPEQFHPFLWQGYSEYLTLFPR